MIFLVESYGSHSNRLFQTAHFEAFCIEYGIRYKNLQFKDMAIYYPNADQKSSFIIKIFVWILLKSKLAKLHSFFTTTDLLETAKKPLLFVGGWSYRDHKLTDKYREILADRYKPSNALMSEIEISQDIERWRAEGFSIVGIHIRRGDYREWEGGRYFYDDSIYKRYIEQMKLTLSSQGLRYRFIIFSNEETGFNNTEECKISTNPWYIDHILMSRCDYLIGPPSTFTLWASYIGKVKFLHISDTHSEIDLSAFRICNG